MRSGGGPAAGGGGGSLGRGGGWALTVPGEGERGGKTGVEKGGAEERFERGGGGAGTPSPPNPAWEGPFLPLSPPLEGMGKLWGGRGHFLLDGDRIPPAHGAADWFSCCCPPTHPPFLPPTALLIGSGLDPAQAATASDWSFPAARPSLQPLLIGSRLDSNPYPPTTATPDWLPTGSCRF